MSTPQRIHVMGPSGSGKTTFAGRIAERLAVPHTELDAIQWLSDWQEAPVEEFRAKVAAAVAGDSWVVDGNYGKARDLVWARVQTVVFLDLSLLICLWRLVRRTSGRVLGRKRLWGGNRETLRNVLFARDSLFVYTLRTYRRRRRQIRRSAADPQLAHIEFLIFRRSQEAEAWLAHLSLT